MDLNDPNMCPNFFRENTEIRIFLTRKNEGLSWIVPELSHFGHWGMGLSCNSSSVGINFLHSFMSGLPQAAC